MLCRKRQDELERKWWEEEAELSAGPAEQGKGGHYSDREAEDEAGHTSWQARPRGGTWLSTHTVARNVTMPPK